MLRSLSSSGYQSTISESTQRVAILLRRLYDKRRDILFGKWRFDSNGKHEFIYQKHAEHHSEIKKNSTISITLNISVLLFHTQREKKIIIF